MEKSWKSADPYVTSVDPSAADYGLNSAWYLYGCRIKCHSRHICYCSRNLQKKINAEAVLQMLYTISKISSKCDADYRHCFSNGMGNHHFTGSKNIHRVLFGFHNQQMGLSAFDEHFAADYWNVPGCFSGVAPERSIVHAIGRGFASRRRNTDENTRSAICPIGSVARL